MSVNSSPELETQPEGEGLRRSLHTRHMTMIAMGGAIGTGLFVASGNSINTAGPGGALVAYIAIGLMVYLLMMSLGEMSAWRPTAGSFGDHAGRYVSPSFGFAIGWNYWFNWAITLAAELVAAALVMRYWFPDVPAWIWSAGFLIIVFSLNALSTRAYGEGEFWLAAIKVTAVIVFLVLGVLMIFGILGGESPGFANWTTGDAPFVGGPITILAIFMVAGFSFQGTELVGVAAGEAKDPETTVPKAIRTVFFRILLFYVGAITVIGFLLPYTHPNLLASGETEVAMSPFTLVLQNAGVAFAASVMNAVILTAILSAGNSGLYASTRMIWSLAMEGKAPTFLRKLNKRGVPIYALIATSSFGLLAFLTTFIGEGAAYTWLINASALAGFIVWAGIAWTHYNFRKAFKAQGRSISELPFRAKFFPVGPIIALAMCLLVIVGQSYEAFINGTVTPMSLLSSYIGLPLFLAFWIGHKVITKSHRVDPAHADLSRNQMDVTR
ncbi:MULTISPECIES: amino acid permease [Kocuria]|uniref:Amino acid permease n=1 Tax=Kocuria subflava TaxID=1736139 RepID=A0A846TRH6_9MICC|nr:MULTISPECIES: amino acid permease [Kocuria]NKE08444.1 amino acid permease [Kocuria subflava]